MRDFLSKHKVVIGAVVVALALIGAFVWVIVPKGSPQQAGTINAPANNNDPSVNTEQPVEDDNNEKPQKEYSESYKQLINNFGSSSNTVVKNEDEQVTDENIINAAKKQISDGVAAYNNDGSKDVSETTTQITNTYFYGYSKTADVLANYTKDNKATFDDGSLKVFKTKDDGIYKVIFSVTNHKLNKTYYVDGWYDQNANQTKISDIIVDGEMISK